nr:hypothetical protein [Clostridia bacterium]
MEGCEITVITNHILVSFCEHALKKKSLYMWGTYGKPITSSLISSKAKQYPDRYSPARIAFLKRHADGTTVGCDCAGLIKWALWTDGNIYGKIKYSAKTDRGAQGLFEASKEKGKINTMPNVPGIVLWKPGHVGVYVGNKEVIECTLGSRGDGIVKTPLSYGGWTYWLKVPEVMYIEDVAKKKMSILEKLKMVLRY